jgi:transcription antitermination factor NusG
VLGKLIKYQADAYAPCSQVRDLVLAEVGIDPQRSPWPLVGSHPLGLYRIIGFAHRNQRVNIASARYTGARVPMCRDFGRGMWGLTLAGVEHAKSLMHTELPKVTPILNPETDLSVALPEGCVSRGDSRDDLTWVVIELTRLGELRVEEGILERSLLRCLHADAEECTVFVPATSYTKGDKVVTIKLMEGYAFISTGLPEVAYFSLERSGYVSQVMSTIGPHGLRVLHTIPNRNILDMQRKLRSLAMLDVSPNDHVNVIEGKYAGLEMEVLFVEEDYIILQTLGLRSLNVITRLPAAFLSLRETE